MLFLFSLSHKFLSDFKGFLHIFYNLKPVKSLIFFARASGARDALFSSFDVVHTQTMHSRVCSWVAIILFGLMKNFASVTSDEVKYTPYVSCTRHIVAYVHLAQNVQLTSNILKVFAYELRRKHVYRYVRNCC